MKNNFDNYIFDLDGTLINSFNEVIVCFKQAFNKAQYEIDETRLNSNLIGPPLEDIVRLIAPEINEEKLREVTHNFHMFYDYEENDVSEIYDGVYETLDFLKGNGKRIFMATFKPTTPTLRIIKQFKLNYFEDVYTIDKFEKPITKTQMIEDIVQKYNFDKNKTVMVGDALSDMKAGKEAGVISIGALWGYGTNKAPLIEQGDFCINNLKELIWER